MRARLATFALGSALAACGGNEATPAGADRELGRCVTCHLSDYRAAQNHEGAKPTTCASCHAETAWHPAHLQHAWPLTGAHEKTGCFGCHVGERPVYLQTSKLCVACHEKARIRASSELNAHTHYSSSCEECHSTRAWKPPLRRETPKPAPRAPDLVTQPSR